MFHSHVAAGDHALLAPRVAPARELTEELLNLVAADLQGQILDHDPGGQDEVDFAVVRAHGHGLAVAGEVGLDGRGHGAGELGRLAPDDVGVDGLLDKGRELTPGVEVNLVDEVMAGSGVDLGGREQVGVED